MTKKGQLKVIDFHTHTLPNMDDGCKTPEESATVLDVMFKQGIKKVAATPHFYADDESPEEFFKRREKSYNELRRKIGFNSQYPELLLGAEVKYFRGISSFKNLSDFSIEGTPLLLLEMPFGGWSDNAVEEVCNIESRHGIKPLLAHIERFSEHKKRKDYFEEMKECGVLFQSNAEFILNKFSSFKALKMLKNADINFLGSDCHGIASRGPNFGDAILKIRENLGTDIINSIETNEKNYSVHLIFKFHKVLKDWDEI